MFIVRLVFTICVLLANAENSSPISKYRLSKDVIPDLYDIHIKPYLHFADGRKQFSFDGQVNITLHAVVNQIMKITLHKKLLEIVHANLFDTDKNSVYRIDGDNMLYDFNTDKLEINLTKPLMVDKSYTLNFIYRGQIRDDMTGFFRTTNDYKHWYGVTQLHRINARTVFPCFDEPEFKAKFRMHISRTHDYSTFFNTRLIYSTYEGDRIVDHFEETPQMSTYLVAFVISDFKSHGSGDFKIITDKNLLNKTNFAFEVGLKAIEALSNYTQQHYKSLGNLLMQMVGTDNFTHNSMENWGLVLYNVHILVQESGYSDGWFSKELTIKSLFHEMAHMWFGSSVTHKWWNCLWLNEAFSTYYQYFLANEFYPEYEFDKQFLVEDLHFIFDLDAENNTQPLTSSEETINTPTEINWKFSDIAYFKGAAVLRMFKNLMGEGNFDKAIRTYLKENHLKSTTPDDLFKQLKLNWPTNHKVNLDEFFRDWTEQVGYPVVEVSSFTNRYYSLKQRRFLSHANDGSNASLKYTIPITYSTDKLNNFNNLAPEFYFSKHDHERVIVNAYYDKWIVVNNQQSNYYRVFYDSQLLRKLKKAFKLKNYSGIHVKNRAGVIDDLFAFAQAGLQGYDEVLDFVEYLKIETEYLPWKAAFKGLQTIYKRLTRAQHYKFGEYVLSLLDKVFKKLSFEDNTGSVLDMKNRNNVISWLCKYRQAKCNQQAQLTFQKHFKRNTKPDSDFRSTLYCAAVREDTSFVYANLMDMFLQQQLPSEKEKILSAMGCTRYFVQEHFEFLLTNNVSHALRETGLRSLYNQTAENVALVFKLIITNAGKVIRVVQTLPPMAKLIEDIAQYLTTQDQLLLLKKFISETGHLFGPSITKLRNSIRIVEQNLQWSAKYLPYLMNYLAKRNVSYRLAKNVIPHLYDMHLKPYLVPGDGDRQFTMDGEVNITMQVAAENLREIRLHKKFIQIIKSVLYDIKGNIIERISNESMIEDFVTETFSVILLNPLEINATYILHFKYHAQISDGMSGACKATYDNINWHVFTQLQMSYARRVFPCFDEPEFKAKFRMCISRLGSYNAVFNTRLIKTTMDGSNYYVDHFEKTPLMSTYLFAFLISDFDVQGDEDYKLIVHPKFKNKANFAYKVGSRILAAFNNYTEMPYNTLGNAIMQLTASSRFPHSGMENWGLIVFKDAVLIQEPGYTDGWSYKANTISVMAHEMAHMWFGNSVTLKWWNCFWLNEGFARYYEYYIAHQLYPEFELDKQFVVKRLHYIFEVDCTNNTQPLTSPEETINTPSEIEKKFSAITYEKGSSVVRMFASLMGRERFDHAVRDYLKENYLKNVVPQNLFKHLKNHWPTEHQVDLDIFFHDWTEQVGYPMVTVSISSSGKLVLKQKRFLTNPYDGSDVTLRYTIPITFTTSAKNNSDPLLYFNKTIDKLEFDKKVFSDGWILFNNQQFNYFRVFYDSTSLGKLLRAFQQQNHSGIHETNRAGVINDLFSFARTGLKVYGEVFEFLEYLTTETGNVPWYAAFQGFEALSKRFTLQQHKEFGKFLHDILHNVYKKLGFQNPNDTISDVHNRNRVISWLCKYHHQDCNAKAKDIFFSHMLNHTRPSVDFRETLYCAACRNDESAVYNNLKKLLQSEELPSERRKIIRAMGCTRYRVQSHFKFILSKSVPNDLKVIGLSSLYEQTPENVMTVLQLIVENVEKLQETLNNGSLTASAITAITEYFSTPEHLEIFKQFTQQKGHLFEDSSNILEKAIKAIETKLRWADMYLPKLTTYLRNRNGGNSISTNILTISLLYLFSQYFI